MVFLNLSNHPIATWSQEQLDAAQALGFGEPAEINGGMPLVPPELDAAGGALMAESIAQLARAEGAGAAVVAGDFTLTFALVQALKSRGVRCYATTSERKVQEYVAANGETIKSAVFRFVRFREYL